MYKKYFKNVPLYLLTMANVILGIQKGFSWVTWLAIILAAIVIFWDVWEAIHHGDQRH